MKCKQQKNKNWAYIYSFLIFFLLYSVFFSGSNPWDVFVALSDQRETPQRDAEEGGVLWRPAQGFGENVPKTEIYQQTRQKEIGIQTRPQRLSGKKTKHICILVTSTGVPYLRTNIYVTCLQPKLWSIPTHFNQLSKFVKTFTSH